ncbi:bifunctional 1-deoxy-D-xylulose 5-phosphate reductoisomerase/1-deoxy-D-xylulose 5-phosphate reductoisomerase [Babesia duncani]|uniref:1-deoxy-D-xylulose-5-phosphate reductoisomerase n=1 Tax=Babesia duncani TaxID=323732 RepID=A0AAD9PIY4_9APIC|nr:bifunctional 1-deoxy-D-xylulose 5-phosphate reductoisomerase/1-deoxy-D-xylulose 5-phosphate reductoisomerase [Babesia duncani]
MSANSNVNDLAKQCNEFKPQYVHVNENQDQLKNELDYSPEIYFGNPGLLDIVTNVQCDLLIMGISGCAGIEPTMVAAKAAKRIALANKESVVSAGPLLKSIVESSNCRIIPIDSEHNAIYQCLTTLPMNPQDAFSTTKTLCGIASDVMKGVKTLYITSSGGPFANKSVEEMKNITLDDALKHPVWSMGSKITIDSSTMMNKGLEVIEAHYLFGIPYDQIKVLIHKQCLIHSMVEFADCSILAQMYLPDMKLPIAYAINWPNRANSNLPSLDVVNTPITFEHPNFEKFPCLALAYEVGKKGGIYPAILNAANEQANALFRSRRIGYHDIYRLTRAAVDHYQDENKVETLEQVLQVDKWARDHVLEISK